MSKSKPTTAERRVMALLREAALSDPNSKCACCNEPITIENISVDHIRPKCLGYLITESENHQILCRKCNEEKGMLSIDYKTKTLIIEPYMFGLDQTKLENLLIRGDITKHEISRKVRRIHIHSVRSRLKQKFIVK